MHTIGIIGGLSPQSTVTYYREICERVRKARGGLSGPPLRMASLDQQEIVTLRQEGQWDRVAAILCDNARALEKAGAECILIACNSVHKVAESVENALSIPFLHIVDATAAGILTTSVRTIGLLGTRYSMEMGFYQERLRRFGIATVTPDKPLRDEIHRIIFEELCIGVIRPESRMLLFRAAHELTEAGAQGLVLGCTEIDLIVTPADFQIPVFDSTALHIDRAVRFILGERQNGHIEVAGIRTAAGTELR